ncbi:uncharacterized protein LOC134845613 [Symsagittifera roscoffensis]|uniref:uncharacterized protein LOC134845613 n=1 Tax=Symsagittifera roscoffensis TaxID=84072 RepID=UPI00307C2BDD
MTIRFMSLNFVAFVLIAFIRNSESTYGKESNDVEQEELCQAFCQLKCMKEDYSQIQCVPRCYRPGDTFGKSVSQCMAKECKQESCSVYAFSADSAPSPSTVEVKKLDPSRPVGEKILLVWDSSTPSSSSSSSSGGGGSGLHQVVYSVESRQWGSSKWNFEALIDDQSMELNYGTCKFYRVAAVNTQGSRGYSKAVTFVPRQPTRIDFGAQHFDQGWILSEVTWQLESRTETQASSSFNSYSSNHYQKPRSEALLSWGSRAEYVLYVEKSACDSYPGKVEMVPGLSGVKTKSNKFLLKLEAPEERGCYKYHIKISLLLECGVHGDTGSQILKVDRARPCAANSIVNNPDCPDSAMGSNFQYPFDQSENYDLILESSATAFYSPSKQFAISLSWVFSSYASSPSSIQVAIEWRRLTNTNKHFYNRNNESSDAKQIVVSGAVKHVLYVEPDSTYSVKISQGNTVRSNTITHSVYVSRQLEEEYRLSLPTEGTRGGTKQGVSHVNVELLSLTPSILTLLIVMSTFMIVLLIGLLSFVVKRKLIRPRNNARHRLMHCAGGTQGMRGGVDPNMYYWWNEEQAALAAAQAGGGMYDSWEVQLEDVYLYDVILQGSYGAVYKGAIPVQSNIALTASPGVPGSPSHPQPEKTILPSVIKMLAESVSETDKLHFRKEVEILKRVGYHDNLLNLLACTTLTAPMCMVLEDGCQGDLLGYLRMFKMDSNESEYSLQSSPNYSTLRTLPRSQGLWSNRSKQQDDLVPPSNCMLEAFAKQICLAMSHLSSKGLFHRDLACRNILLTQDYSVKVGDYSMVRFAYSHPEYLSRISGKMPIKWMAIEVLQDQTFTPKSDVWSFGVVLYELCTLGSVPFPNIPSADLLKTLLTGYRMDQPNTCSDTLYNMMIRCWRENPEERPDFPQLLTALTDHSEENPHSSLIQLNNDDNSSSGEQHHTECPPPPVPPKKPNNAPVGQTGPSQNVMGSQRGSVSGQQMGLESNTLSSSEAGSMKRKMSSPNVVQPQLTLAENDTPRRTSATFQNTPKHNIPQSQPNNQLAMTSLKSPTNEIRENEDRDTSVKSNEFGPYRPENNSLKTFAGRSGNKPSPTLPRANESAPRKTSLNGSEALRSNGNSSSRGDLTALSSSGTGSKPANGLQSFGGRQTPIMFGNTSNSNQNTLTHPDKKSSVASCVSHAETATSKFI